jgi:hypothetical protein
VGDYESRERMKREQKSEREGMRERERMRQRMMRIRAARDERQEIGR